MPLDYFDNELDSENNQKDQPTPKTQGPGAERDWSPEQLEILQMFGADQLWKFNYDSVIEYCLSQNTLHERCQKMARLGYRVDQIVGIQHNYAAKQP